VPGGPAGGGFAAAPLTLLSGERVLSLYRIVVGLLFACHGAASLFNVLDGPRGGPLAIGEWPGWWAALTQLVGGFLTVGTVGASDLD
jgi:putative oxidoreductase